MAKVLLYIAQSQDGYIADKNGSFDFLNNFSYPSETVSRFNDFISRIDTVVMGFNIYKQIVNEISPNIWPYRMQTSFVFTNNLNEQIVDDENINFIKGDVVEALKLIKSYAEKDIWLVGGANLVKQFHNSGLIDEYIITTVPVVLGEGVELFRDTIKLDSLESVSKQEYGDFVDSVYVHKT